MNFIEPVLGIVKRVEHTNENKYMVYPHAPGPTMEEAGMKINSSIFSEIITLLKSSGVSSYDLKPDNFIISETGGRRVLKLIDTESYTKAEK